MAELTKLLADLGIIALLDDEPNDVGGLSAEELKAKFDEAANIIKDYINETLLPELASDIGAQNIGIETISGVTGATNVQAALAKIESQLVDMTQGAVADGSINAAKLADAAVVAEKIANLAVTTAALADGSVTTPKLANLAVTAEKLAALAVTSAKLAAGAVTNEKIADGAVGTAKLALAAVGTAQIDDIAVTAAKLAAAAVETAKIANGAVTSAKLAVGATHDTKTAVLTVAGWISAEEGANQTVTVQGINSTDTLIVSPAPNSISTASEANVYCSAQGNGTLSFHCADVPEAEITYNVVILV